MPLAASVSRVWRQSAKLRGLASNLMSLSRRFFGASAFIR
jgi:hypothetical protein